MAHLDIQRVLQSAATVSDKIRALAAMGLARAEIARVLGKRYQHVRNVLEADKLRDHGGGVAEDAPSTFDAGPSGPVMTFTQPGGGLFRLVLDGSGRLEVPVELSQAWGLKPGSVLTGRLQGDEFSIVTQATSIRRAQEIVMRLIPRDVSLSEELIADRRREAVSEEARG